MEPGELNVARTAATTSRPEYISRRQMRARSAGPVSHRTSRLMQQLVETEENINLVMSAMI